MYKSIKQIAAKEEGYTFIESIIQLAIYALFAQLFVILMLWATKHDASALTKEHTEWELFINDFLSYLSKGQQVEIINNGKGISIQIADQWINIEKYNQMIRKKVNALGHEPMLIGIKDVQFSQRHGKLLIAVEFISGLKKEREFVVSLRKE